ncbi:HET-domain-containing protein [Setomelanomma holmii]|uniref:HET-domain-containing protein n=1 Tax=Setomelanomma holmii TaxID=210430 RepID=A0A9P4HLQ6_9PLEO|nr:HET-domain-containing protein [Setomelanomma holmii]
MLCKTCVGMLQNNQGKVLDNSTRLSFEHHKTTAALRKASREECFICMALARLLEPKILSKDQPIIISADLYNLLTKTQRRAKFALDFQMENPQPKATLKYTFVLNETSGSQHLPLSKATSTSSDEVHAMAKNWIKGCRCADGWNEPGRKWYPKRLLDLEGLRTANASVKKVRLIESDAFMKETKMVGGNRVYKHPNYRYVTLSHCWGKPRSGHEPLKLTSNTMKKFMTDGIDLRELPKTFRDAVLFASGLEGVRFVWIDSLCIRQPIKSRDYDEKEQLSDWVEQSRFMDKVYRKAYLNISATASTDGSGGLFFERKPEHLLDEEVDVRYPQPGHGPKELTRCTISNASAWLELVDQAPINKRGWVLQERLLAPRVLHFCSNQVAWECGEFESAESHPENMTELKTELYGEAPHGRIKEMTPSAGKTSRNIRLKGLPDPDLGMPDLYAFELWKRVVEMYSTTNLSHPSDKLVALSGIATHFQRHLLSASTSRLYIAGLWSQNLESQLLWSVNDVWNAAARRFENPAKRVPGRAPSFSWAAIDSPLGITYGDVTDFGASLAVDRGRRDYGHNMEISGPSDQLLFKVLNHNITLLDDRNPFGVVKAGHLLIKPRYLRRIELEVRPERAAAYCWTLKQMPGQDMPVRRREYGKFNLDAPGSDVDIFRQDAILYVMLAAFGPRTVWEEDRCLYCLLLKLEDPLTLSALKNGKKAYRAFRRVGLTKLSSGEAERDMKTLRGIETDEVICLL